MTDPAGADLTAVAQAFYEVENGADPVFVRTRPRRDAHVHAVAVGP